jgi:hypothetical protein
MRIGSSAVCSGALCKPILPIGCIFLRKELHRGAPGVTVAFHALAQREAASFRCITRKRAFAPILELSRWHIPASRVLTEH